MWAALGHGFLRGLGAAAGSRRLGRGLPLTGPASGARGLPQTSAEREQPASRLFSPLWEGVTGTRLLFRVIPAEHGLKR